MSKEQQNYVSLTVYSEDGDEPFVMDKDNPKVLKQALYVKMELSTGLMDHEKEIRFDIYDDDDNCLAQFCVSSTVAQYIQNYIKTYLQIINN
jgi:hypothetical protein